MGRAFRSSNSTWFSIQLTRMHECEVLRTLYCSDEWLGTACMCRPTPVALTTVLRSMEDRRVSGAADGLTDEHAYGITP